MTERSNKTYVYSYDDRGNILYKKTYAYTTGTLGTVQKTDTYGYFGQSETAMWSDGLKTYNGSVAFTYDGVGNPLTYNNGLSYTFTWQNGRELVSGTKGTTSFAYTYNADGLRTKKIVGNTVYDYYWFGTQLAMMTITSGTSVTTLKFYYDDNGLPLMLEYNGTRYFYITNLQGDVLGLADESGMGAYYNYDAWGNILQMDAATTSYYNAMTANPLRYRGYIYDTETGFYYLQSRYYDPAVCRFINEDSYISTGTGLLGYNMFSYCNNNPVLNIDSTGKNAEAVLKAWTLGMPWLTLVDGPLPVGDITYVVIMVILILTTPCDDSLVLPDFNELELESNSNDDTNNTNSNTENERKLPITGEPNSDRELYDEEGLKQKRHYGPDGRAEYDIDYRHQNSDGTHKFPHRHDWDWTKNPPRSKGYDIS